MPFYSRRGKQSHFPEIVDGISNRLKGLDSRWFGYIQSLPRQPVGIALLWGSDLVQQQQQQEPGSLSNRDSELARIWAKGTEIEKEGRGEDGKLLLVSDSIITPDLLFVFRRPVRGGTNGTGLNSGHLIALSCHFRFVCHGDRVLNGHASKLEVLTSICCACFFFLIFGRTRRGNTTCRWCNLYCQNCQSATQYTDLYMPIRS